jgi:hypothetical protein
VGLPLHEQRLPPARACGAGAVRSGRHVLLLLLLLLVVVRLMLLLHMEKRT